MQPETKILFLCLATLAACLVLAITKVLGAWADHHITRHDLVVESKQKRLDYYNAVADMMHDAAQGDHSDGNATVIIEDDEQPPAMAA